MDLDKAIKTFSEVKKFNSKKPNWRHIIEAIDAARYAPMAGNIFTPRFILVQDKEKIQAIADSTSQPFVAQCSYVVVMFSEITKTSIAFGNESKNYIKTQSGAAIQNFLLKLSEKKLGTTWIKLFIEKNIKSILKIPENFQIEAIFPIGYEFKKEEKDKKIPNMDNLLFYDEYKHSRMSEPKTAGKDTSRPWI